MQRAAATHQGDALPKLVMSKHIRKGAIVHLGSAMWEGDTYVSGITTYRHMPERDTDFASAWELVGSDLVQYLTANSE